jgi:hypothetical protein
MHFRSAAVPLLGAGVACLASCTSPPPTPVAVNITVESDPGDPLPGAQVLFHGKLVGISSATGTVALTLTGPEGQMFDLSIQCPEGHRSPAEPLSIVLRRLGDSGVAPEYKASCPPLVRPIVVAVVADKGPNLPVMYLGREIARTDDLGAASVLLQGTPGEQVTLSLSTEDKSARQLRPKDPAMTFNVRDQSDVFLFDPHFSLPPKPKPQVAVATGPVKIKTHTLAR